jgi:hypothetical protein
MNRQDTRILSQLQSIASERDDWLAGALHSTSAIHIAVMSEPFLSYVFNGKKTVESRFSLHAIAPYQKVAPNDVVLMKAGSLVGGFRVEWVRHFDLDSTPIDTIITTYGDAICGNKAFWKQKASKRYVTLLGIGTVDTFLPFEIAKSDRRAWVSIHR